MLKPSDVGRHLVAGFNGTGLSEHLLELLKLSVGGVILFSRNYESPEQLFELTRQIRERAPSGLFIGVDQEGGRVLRLKAPFTQWPAMALLGATDDDALAERFGKALAAELSAAGVDWVFAPVMDVNSNPKNPVIGDRAFGDDPALVSRMGAAVIRGIMAGGVMPCAKHYPGHGDTSEDSHKKLPMVMANEQVLCERELAPFCAAAECGVPSIMTAHVIYPAWDLAHPATTSRVLIEGQLRRGIGYDGIVITDDLEMAAVADRYDPDDLIRLAFYAGNDMLLACHAFELQERIVRTLFDARSTNLLNVELYIQREKRILAAAGAHGLPRPGPLSVIGCEEHLALAEEIRDRGANLEE